MGEDLMHLIKKCKDKSEESVVLAIEQFYPLIRKYEKMLNYEDARYDLQEKFIAILYHIPECTNKYQVLSYIKTSMNRAYIKLSQNNRKYYYNVPIENIDTQEYFLNLDCEAIIDLEKALDKLTMKQKKVIIYKFIDGLQVNQIVEKMGISRQAVNKNEKKALIFLRSYLSTEGGNYGN